MTKLLRRPVVAMVLLALFALCLPACRDSGTDPVGGYRIAVTGSFSTVPLAPNLRRFQLVLDGTAVLQDISFRDPSVGVTLDGRLDYVGRGPHSLRFLVLDQAASPFRYQAVDVVISYYDSYGGLVNRIIVPPNSQSLANGQSMIYDFVL